MKKIVFIFAGILSSGILGMERGEGDPLGLGSEGGSVPGTDLSASWVLPSSSVRGPEESITSLNTQPSHMGGESGNESDTELSPNGTPTAPHLPAVAEEAPLPTPHGPNIFDQAAQAAVLAQVQATIGKCPDVEALRRLSEFGNNLSLAAKARIDELNPPPAAPKITWIQAHLMGPIKPWMNYESLTALAFVAAILIPRLMGVAHSDFKA